MEPEQERRAMVVQQALERAPFSMRQLATASGLSYATLRAWSARAPVAPQPDSMRKLAAGLRKRSEELAELAREVEGAADRGEAV